MLAPCYEVFLVDLVLPVEAVILEGCLPASSKLAATDYHYMVKRNCDSTVSASVPRGALH